MKMIAKNVSEGIELVELMLKGDVTINGEWHDASWNEAYLDWEDDDIYCNITSKYYADEVAKVFKERGYFVYYQVYGIGGAKPQGTPACIRIRKYPKDSMSYIPF